MNFEVVGNAAKHFFHDDSEFGRALHRYRRGHGFKSRSGLNFFRLYFYNFLSCVYNCDDQSCLLS